MPDQAARLEAAAADAAEAAIAARCAPAYVAGLQHAHVGVVIPCQVVGGGQPGIAATDNRDVAGLVCLQRRRRERRRWRRGFPIARLRRREVVQIVVVKPPQGSYSRFTRLAQASMASRLVSTSACVVDQLQTLMRMARRPCQTVPPHQQVPSR